MRTSELTGAALDWAVAKCEGKVEQGAYGTPEFRDGAVHIHYCDATLSGCYSPSTLWTQGGPIIEREHIALDYYHTPIHPDVQPLWGARHGSVAFEYGLTPLIAAMRCYVASKLGEEVEIPT